MSTLHVNDLLSERIESLDHCQTMIITPDRDDDDDLRVDDSADNEEYDPEPIAKPSPKSWPKKVRNKNSKPKLILDRNFMCFFRHIYSIMNHSGGESKTCTKSLRSNESIYKVFWTDILSPIKSFLLGWKRISKDVRVCCFQAARLVRYIHNVLSTYLLRCFVSSIFEDITKSMYERANADVLCNVAILYRECISFQSALIMGNKDTCIFPSMTKGKLAVRVNHLRKATTPLRYTSRKSL